MKNLNILIIMALVFFVGCKDERSDSGDKYFKNGDYQKAVAEYTEYLRLEPTDVKTLYNRGRAYQELGEHEKALADFNRVLKEDPNNINTLLSLASDYYYRLKDYENTVFFAEKVIKVDNNNATAHTLKGKANQKLGNLNEAMAAYNAALSVNKEYADAYLSRGSLRVHLNQYRGACADFRMAEGLGADAAAGLIQKYCN